LEARLLQDWVTIQATSDSPVLFSQGAAGWLDVGDANDLVFFLEMTQGAGALMAYQAAPAPEEGAFANLTPPFITVAGLQVTPAVGSVATCAPARFARWQLQFSSPTNRSQTFRIWIAAYSLRRPA
jgi:hypothetical protein